MNILCWNYRGLGNPQIEQELGDLIWAQAPSFVFLAETWLDKARVETIKVRYKFGGMIEVSRVNKEGVWLFFGRQSAILKLTHTPLITLMLL